MMDRLFELLLNFRAMRDEKGQTAVEYALVLVLVALVLATALAALDGSLDNVVTDITTALGGGGGS